MYLVLDTENTFWNKGSPFDARNFNVCIGYSTDEGDSGVVFRGEAGDDQFRDILRRCSTIVGFNLKYDLHWLRKLGYDLRGKRFFCCQVAEFTLNRQQPAYPNLDGCAVKYGLPRKLDIIKTEYWEKGINTHEIPRSILSEYCANDVESTKQLYTLLVDRIGSTVQRSLLSLLMQDTEVLEEIEWNGLAFDRRVVEKRQKEIDDEINNIKKSLGIFTNVPNFNWASNHHLSALLYGGTIEETIKVPVGVYKTGQKAGQVKHQNQILTHTLPRMYNPPKGSETAKEGVWSVDEDTLKKIKGGKKLLIDGILKIKGLSKLQTTYVAGLMQKHLEMHQPEGFIHGQYNQCVAATGRLSSSAPNMQNMAGDIQDMFISRWQ